MSSEAFIDRWTFGHFFNKELDCVVEEKFDRSRWPDDEVLRRTKVVGVVGVLIMPTIQLTLIEFTQISTNRIKQGENNYVHVLYRRKGHDSGFRGVAILWRILAECPKIRANNINFFNVRINFRFRNFLRLSLYIIVFFLLQQRLLNGALDYHTSS